MGNEGGGRRWGEGDKNVNGKVCLWEMIVEREKSVCLCARFALERRKYEAVVV